MKKTHIKVDKDWYPACHDKMMYGDDFPEGCGGALVSIDSTLIDVCVRCPFRNKMYEEGKH